MMDEQQVDQDALFYEFSVEKHVPVDHMLRSIDRFVDLGRQCRAAIAIAMISTTENRQRRLSSPRPASLLVELVRIDLGAARQDRAEDLAAEGSRLRFHSSSTSEIR